MSVWNKMAWGGDPDEISAVTGLTRRDIFNIKKSWKVMNAESEKYGLLLFYKFFRLNPTAQTYFKMIENLDEEAIPKNARFRAHVIDVMASLNSAVVNIDQPEIVVVLMNKLGAKHESKHVQKEHFDEVKVCLVDILKNHLKAKDEVIASWARFVNFIYKHIFEKLCDNK